MKKVNVRVKPKSTKSSFTKAYIVAAGFSAILCAVVLSFVLKPMGGIDNNPKIEMPTPEPEEISQVSEPIELEIPIKEEVIETNEPEVKEPVEEPNDTEVFKKEEINFLLPASGDIINDFSLTSPKKSKATGEWRVHAGIDISGSAGADVLSPASGEVILSKNDKLTGNTVSIKHKDGFVSTVYNLGDISVTVGEKVSSGDKIGTIGTSSLLEAEDAPHVHFELKKDGKTVNPEDYIK